MCFGPGLLLQPLGVVVFSQSSTSKATSAGLVRSYRNVPRRESSTKSCTGIRHLCLGGRPGYDYEHMSLDYLRTGVGLGYVRSQTKSPPTPGARCWLSPSPFSFRLDLGQGPLHSCPQWRWKLLGMRSQCSCSSCMTCRDQLPSTRLTCSTQSV